MQTKASYLLLPFLFLTHLPFAKADLITDLGTGYAYGINASGEVVGTTSTPLQAFLYSGGDHHLFWCQWWECGICGQCIRPNYRILRF